MAGYCTCGTQLVDEALFCHKCGKPQREILPEEPETTGIAPPPPAPAAVAFEPPPVNFQNRLAIKIGLVMAILATLLSFLVYVNWVAAGFFTVLVYRRRTGYPLNLRAGMRLGWITGILMFVMMTVIMTAGFVLISSGGLAGVPAEIRNSLDPRFQEALKVLQSGPAVAEMIGMLFVFTTLLSMAGGALGAKLFSRGR